jgi:hypothetical protein
MPIYIPLPYEEYVYSTDEIDDLLLLKADKVEDAGHLNIAGLSGVDGNLLDLGVKIEDLLFGEIADGGLFDNTGELDAP